MSRSPATSVSEGVPDLVIEVLSPKTAGQIRERSWRSIGRLASRSTGSWDPLSRTVVIHRLGEKSVYEEWARVGEGKTVTSAVLPGLRACGVEDLPVEEVIAVTPVRSDSEGIRIAPHETGGSGICARVTQIPVLEEFFQIGSSLKLLTVSAVSDEFEQCHHIVDLVPSKIA